MEPWKQKYIEMIREGFMSEQICRALKIQGGFVAMHMKRDPDFAAQVTSAIPARENRTFLPLDAEHLFPFACSQCTDEEMAGVFGMEVPEFKKYISEDEVLKSIYTNGKKAGQANIRREQYNQGVAGDRVMLQHLGKHVLGQDDTQKHIVERKNPLDNENELERVLASLIHRRRLTGNVIDGEAISVQEALGPPSPDNLPGPSQVNLPAYSQVSLHTSPPAKPPAKKRKPRTDTDDPLDEWTALE